MDEYEKLEEELKKVYEVIIISTIDCRQVCVSSTVEPCHTTTLLIAGLHVMSLHFKIRIYQTI